MAEIIIQLADVARGAMMKSLRIAYYSDLLRELVSRDFKVRYKRSVVGFVWTFANPLLYLCVFYFVFQLALSVRIPRFGPFAFIGILVWTWFQSSIIQAMGAIVGNRELIRTPGFVPAVLPVVSVVTNMLHFLAGLVLFTIFLVLTRTDFSAILLLLPILILLQSVLTLGIAYLVAAVNVSFRDVGHLVTVLLQLLFFLTPVFYDANLVPEAYQPIYRLNPMVVVVESYRAVLLGFSSISWREIGIVAFLSPALLYFAYKTFVKRSNRFAEEL